MVKPEAFLPALNPVETSVFRMTGLGGPEIQRFGQGLRPTQTLHAWANVVAGVVFAVGLDVRPDNRPPRHATIVGWPSEKHERLMLAQELAASATLRLPAP